MNHTPLLFVSCGDPLSINFEILAKTIKQHKEQIIVIVGSFYLWSCLLYTSPSPRDGLLSRMPSSA